MTCNGGSDQEREEGGEEKVKSKESKVVTPRARHTRSDGAGPSFSEGL